MGPFIHRIDPVICDIGGVYLWWYGLSFTLGFSGIHFWFRRMRDRLGLSLVEVYDVSLALSVGVLLGGRLVEVFFYEWEYYGAHLVHIPAAGLGMLFWFYRRGAEPTARVATCGAAPGGPAPRLRPRRALLLLILFLCPVIPSDWTQDIPSRYGERHPGLDYSILYPKVENRPVEGRGTPDPAGPKVTP